MAKPSLKKFYGSQVIFPQPSLPEQRKSPTHSRVHHQKASTISYITLHGSPESMWTQTKYGQIGQASLMRLVISSTVILEKLKTQTLFSSLGLTNSLVR